MASLTEVPGEQPITIARHAGLPLLLTLTKLAEDGGGPFDLSGRRVRLFVKSHQNAPNDSTALLVYDTADASIVVVGSPDGGVLQVNRGPTDFDSPTLFPRGGKFAYTVLVGPDDEPALIGPWNIADV